MHNPLDLALNYDRFVESPHLEDLAGKCGNWRLHLVSGDMDRVAVVDSGRQIRYH